MECSTIHLVYFSPTRTSAKIAQGIVRGIQINNIETIDLTYDSSKDDLFIDNGLMLLSVPVYAGRVAPIALERIHRLRGKETPVILSVVYGNRDYEDALVELRDTLTKQGFIPLSAGAFIGEHSYSRPNMPIAEGRPNEEDIAQAQHFGVLSYQKFRELNSINSLSSFFIKGNIPYKEVLSPTPATPSTLENQCILCTHCLSVCPTNAIYLNSRGAIESDEMKCIKCCACVKECSYGSRIFDTPYTAMLHQKCAAPRTSEYFL